MKKKLLLDLSEYYILFYITGIIFLFFSLVHIIDMIQFNNQYLSINNRQLWLILILPTISSVSFLLAIYLDVINKKNKSKIFLILLYKSIKNHLYNQLVEIYSILKKKFISDNY